jgi:hypothetical protein
MRPPEPGAADDFVIGLSPGIHRAPSALTAASLETALNASGLATLVVDLRDAEEKAQILDVFATGLRFPSWVGRNWDALDDALRDLSWLPTGTRGRAILLLSPRQPSASPSDELEVVHDVLKWAVESQAATRTPLIVVTAIHGDAGEPGAVR